MFTGIVKELGRIEGIDKTGSVYRLSIASSGIYAAVSTGDSVSVNGVCLTLVDKNGRVLSFDVTEETVRRSDLISLNRGQIVNLEVSLKADGYLGGHFVLGHVDCVGRIKEIRQGRDGYVIDIEYPGEFAHLLVEKGSVALDGISLTVGEVRGGMFSVNLVPHTLKATNMGLKRRGDSVNIEFDIIGKYIARLKQAGDAPRITEEFLRERGF